MFMRIISVFIAVSCVVFAIAVLNGHEPSTTSTVIDQATIAVLFLLWGFVWNKEE